MREEEHETCVFWCDNVGLTQTADLLGWSREREIAAYRPVALSDYLIGPFPQHTPTQRRSWLTEMELFQWILFTFSFTVFVMNSIHCDWHEYEGVWISLFFHVVSGKHRVKLMLLFWSSLHSGWALFLLSLLLSCYWFYVHLSRLHELFGQENKDR